VDDRNRGAHGQRSTVDGDGGGGGADAHDGGGADVGW
jgi:hypothetical protein